MNDKDLRIDAWRSYTGTYYRLMHFPTGIVLEGEDNIEDLKEKMQFLVYWTNKVEQ